MTTRFWAPVRASIAPDAVVLAMLDPDTGDIGTKILAAHRAGASACESVRQNALPSEQGLLDALRATRALVADPMVTGIAKALGGSYAGLLVRDIWDDGEQGALDLYRAAVAKGVSPPLAVTRVGEVFGVPMRELGPYAALAVDPKSTPVVLTDAADRALMRYVSKLSALEMDQRYEEVSKAPATERERVAEVAWDETRVKRDEDGQFAPQTQTGGTSVMDRLRARLGISGAPDVAGEQKAEQAEQKRQGQQKRQKRQTRQTRQKPQLVLARTKPVRTPDARTNAVRTPVKRKSEKFKAQVIRQNGGLFTPPTHLDAPLIVQIDNAMARIPTNESIDYEEVTTPLTMAVPITTGMAFMRSLTDPGTPGDRRRVFRMGYLSDLTGSPEVLGLTEGDRLRGAAATAERRHPDNAEYDAPLESDLHKVAGAPEQDLYDMVASQKRQIAGDDDEEISSIVQATDYETGQQILVHLRPVDEEAPDEYRPRPTVTEYVVDTARAVVDGRTYTGRRQHLEYRLDPNQAFRIDHTPEVLYDAGNEVFVHRYHLVPIDDALANEIENKVGKALEPAQLMDFEQQHARDEDGQFAPMAERRSGVAPTEEPAQVTRQQRQTRQGQQKRQKRQTRQGRQTRQASAARVVERAPDKRLPPERQADQRHVDLRAGIERAVTRRGPSAPRLKEMPPLDDDNLYKVMTGSEFATLFDLSSVSPGVIPVTDINALETLQQDHVSGEGVGGDLSMNVDRQVRAQDGHFSGFTAGNLPPTNRRNLGTWMAKTPQDYETLGKRVHELFTRNPDLAQIQLHDKLDGTSRVELWGSKTPVDHQVVIEMDRDLDLTQPVELVHMGDQRSIDTRRHRKDVPGPKYVSIIGDGEPYNVDLRLYLLANVEVRRYLLANVKVRRYRAQNSDDG